MIKLYENCQITKGISRSLIADMQRNDFYLVPNSLAELFNDKHVFDTSTVLKKTGQNEVIKEYEDFLLEHEIAFYCHEELIDNFPVLEIEKWDYPAKITNAILETSLADFPSRLTLLEALCNDFLTRHIEVHFTEPMNFECLQRMFQQLDTLDLYSYNVILCMEPDEEMQKIIELIKSHYKIFRSIIYNAGKSEIILSDKGGWGNIFLVKETFSYQSCGIVDKEHFCINIEHITESQKHNTCLNRKIFIGADGIIRNCPNMKTDFGNISSTGIEEVINQPAFQKLWHINKNQIAVCKDCEFRHICTDCRAYLENPEDIFSKPLKCGYNPYTCEWEEWSNYYLKQSGIAYYGFEK